MSEPAQSKSSKEHKTEQVARRSAGPPAQDTPFADILALQDAAGNHATNALFQSIGGYSRPIQPRSLVSHPGDKHEQEAERVAEQILHQPISEADEESITTRQVGIHSHGEGETSHGFSRHSGGNGNGGVSLAQTVRATLEPRFGRDLSSVRIHTGIGASQAARSLNARAFTIGHDIFFAHGQYAPGSDTGQRLLAHELVHVVQQDAAGLVVQNGKGADSVGFGGTLSDNSTTTPLPQISQANTATPIIQRNGGPILSGMRDPSTSPGTVERSESFNRLIDAPAEELNVAEELLAGALIGDFREDHSFWTTIGQIVVGFVPYAGQVADVRDLIAGLNRIINHGGWRSGWEWLNLVLILIGFVPGLGDIIKGAGRAGLRWLRRSRLIDDIVRALSRHVVEPALEHVIRPVINRIKREIERLVEWIGERIRRVVEGRRAAARRALAERQYRRQLEQLLREAEERAARRGKTALDNVTDPRLRRWAEANPRHRELAYDHAQRGFTDNSVREAQAGLAAEGQGILRSPIRRDLSGGAEFIDGAGIHWDVKRPEVDSIVAELTGTNHHVLINAADISRSQQRRLLDQVRARLASEGRQELMERVRAVRPRASTQPLRTARIVTRRATESEEQPETAAQPH